MTIKGFIFQSPLFNYIVQWCPFMQKDLVKKSNSLNEAHYSLTVAEYRILHMMKDFKKRVLDKALEQINEFTDITASYNQIKDGRKITGFKFSYKDKVKAPKALSNKTERDPATVDIFDGFTDLERQTIQQRIDEHIERLETKGETVGEYWRENITKKAIAEHWGLDVLAEQQRKEQEYKTRLAIEQAEMQVKARTEQEKAEQMEQRKNAMIAKFESLPHDEQERIMDTVSQENPMVEMWQYSKKKADGVKVYAEPMFSTFFYKHLGMEIT